MMPACIALSRSLFVADSQNQLIRRVSIETGDTSSVAGTVLRKGVQAGLHDRILVEGS